MSEFSSRDPIPVESSDDAILEMLSGAIFGPDTKLTLPSEIELDGREAQAFTSLFAAETSPVNVPNREPKPEVLRTLKYEDNPLSSEFDDWTDDPIVNSQRLVQRAYDAINRATDQEAAQPPSHEDLSSPKDVSLSRKKSNWAKRLFGRNN
jgi:hypothetical protein